MYRYRIYGLVIESDVEIMQLLKAKDSSFADVYIKQDSCKDEVVGYLEKMGATRKRYEIGLEYSCFENKGGFYVIRNGKEIHYECRDGYTPTMLTSWLTGFALSMLLLQRRCLAIHCSAVAYANEAVLIAGEPGAGKSSVTRKLLDRGYKLMADDVAVLEENESKAFIFPAFPYQKLCRNEVENRKLDLDELIYINEDKDKFLVPADSFESEEKELKCMFFLMVGDVKEVVVEKLSGIRQLIAFKNNLFLHKLPGAWENSKEIGELCLKAAGQCPIYLVVRPFEGDSKEKIADIIDQYCL